MNRWALIEHRVYSVAQIEIHFDFLLESQNDCLTWKMFEIPKLDGNRTEILPHSNHRKNWLSITHQILSRNRGEVNQIDNGKYNIIENSLADEDFIFKLNGNLLSGFFKKKANLCELCTNF